MFISIRLFMNIKLSCFDNHTFLYMYYVFVFPLIHFLLLINPRCAVNLALFFGSNDGVLLFIKSIQVVDNLVFLSVSAVLF